MNHPKLDICKIIGVKFPDSEFVYLSDPRGYGDYHLSACTRIKAVEHLDFVQRFENNQVEILANAPICEELILKLVLLTHSGKFNLADILCQAALNPDKNLTQALAEEVERILTNKGKK